MHTTWVDLPEFLGVLVSCAVTPLRDCVTIVFCFVFAILVRLRYVLESNLIVRVVVQSHLRLGFR